MSETANKLYKLVALSDEIAWFFKSALAGKIQETELPGAESFGSQQNPVSHGLSDGYSVDDIAHFYIARALGEKWIEEILSHLADDFLGQLNEAFKGFGKDVSFEKRFAVEEMRRNV